MLVINIDANMKENSLKIPNGKSEIDNTMTKRKKDKRTNNDLQNNTHKTKD